MDILQTPLETERLLLRPFDINDASTAQKFAGNINVSNIPHPHAKRWIDDDLVNFAIVNKQTGQLMGVVGLVGRSKKVGGIGYWVGEPFGGNGYCTEATKALIDFCFNNLNIERLEAEYLITNPASGRVMKKCGMTFKCSKITKDRNGDDARLNVYNIFRG